MHPPKPRIGIRATRPNEIWHLDAAEIRLVDGTKIYLHAAIDNFSRRILAWGVASRIEPGSTVAVLSEAIRKSECRGSLTDVFVDGGVENFNGDVDKLIESGSLRRLLAMTDVMFSNSMIESWWRSLKGQWLYLHTLDSIASVRKLVKFYVREHNEVIPHSAFHGQTPNEVYFGTGEGVPDNLEKARAEAREARIKTNRATTCAACA